MPITPEQNIIVWEDKYWQEVSLHQMMTTMMMMMALDNLEESPECCASQRLSLLVTSN